jgi:hypothetical protein
MRPLAVALLTHAYALPRWQAQSLERLQSAGVVFVSELIAVDRRALTLERAWLAAEEMLERRPREALAQAIDARAVFPRAPAAGGRFGMPAVDLVISCGVDAAVARGVRGRLGTLACSIAGAEDDIGLFRAFVHGTAVELAATLFPARGDAQVWRARPALPERPLIADASRNVLRRAGVLLEKTLREISDRRAPMPEPAAPPVSPVTLPAAFRYGSGKVLRRLRRGIARLGAGSPSDPDLNWFLAYRTNADAFIRNNERFRSDGYRLILPPPGRFYADPCVLEHDGVDHVFFEEWRADLGKGVISWMRRDGDRFTPPEQVLECPYHLSYPFVFRAGGDIFMIPESSAARRIELYRAVDFPQRWEPAEILVDGIAAADATVLEADGGWWMFANVAEEGSSKCDQLWIFHADSAGGPWRPHVRNPVKIDVRSTRPAGSLFRRGGRLIRPTQDCSATYGGAITLCEVTRLSRGDYAEVEVGKLLPGWLPSNVGFHTLSSSPGLEVIDGKMPSGRESRFPALEGALYAEAPA